MHSLSGVPIMLARSAQWMQAAPDDVDVDVDVEVDVDVAPPEPPAPPAPELEVELELDVAVVVPVVVLDEPHPTTASVAVASDKRAMRTFIERPPRENREEDFELVFTALAAGRSDRR